MGVVCLIGVSLDPIRQRRFNWPANNVCPYHCSNGFAAISASKLHSRLGRKQVSPRNHCGESIEDMLLGLRLDLRWKIAVSSQAHISAELPRNIRMRSGRDSGRRRLLCSPCRPPSHSHRRRQSACAFQYPSPATGHIMSIHNYPFYGLRERKFYTQVPVSSEKAPADRESFPTFVYGWFLPGGFPPPNFAPP